MFPPLRPYPTEVAAKKADLAFADLRGERLSTVLYTLLPEGEKKPTYLLSSTYTDSEKFRNSYGIFPSGTSTTQYGFRELEEHPVSFWILWKWTESVLPADGGRKALGGRAPGHCHQAGQLPP